MGVRINVGCGKTPTPGWTNYDNSLSVKLARRPVLAGFATRFLLPQQADYVRYARNGGVKWADATRHIPERDNSVEVVYSCHMLEHLTDAECAGYLREALRVLRPGGILRTAVPDVRYHVNRYLEDGDAETMISGLHVITPKATSLRQKLTYAAFGDRQHHQRMYDGPLLPPGETRIPDPGALDLRERWPESVFVEAVKPG